MCPNRRFNEAQKVSTPVIAASEKNCVGFKNRTNDPADEIVADLVSGKVPGVLILYPEKVGEVAVRVAQQMAPIRKRKSSLPSIEDISKIAKENAPNASNVNATVHKTSPFPQL